jgi:NADPH2:quinone reductase
MQLEELELCSARPGRSLSGADAIGVNPLDVSQRKGPCPSHCRPDWGWKVRGGWRRWGLGCPACRSGTGRLRHRPAGGLCQCAAVSGPSGAASGHPRNDAAAAVLFKGITAQYLLKTTGQVRPGSTVLIYGAAGRWGSCCAPGLAIWGRRCWVWCPSRQRGAEASGCHAVFVFDAQTLASQVAQATQGRKVDVVYDPIGKDTLPPRWTACVPAG